MSLVTRDGEAFILTDPPVSDPYGYRHEDARCCVGGHPVDCDCPACMPELYEPAELQTELRRVA